MSSRKYSKVLFDWLG